MAGDPQALMGNVVDHRPRPQPAGAAEMMLASARHAVHKRVVHLTPAQTQLDTGEEPAGS